MQTPTDDRKVGQTGADTPKGPERLYLEEAAAYLGKPAGTLRHWRHVGAGPRSYLVLDGRKERVAYDRADLDAFKAGAAIPRDIRGDVAAVNQ